MTEVEKAGWILVMVAGSGWAAALMALAWARYLAYRWDEDVKSWFRLCNKQHRDWVEFVQVTIESMMPLVVQHRMPPMRRRVAEPVVIEDDDADECGCDDCPEPCSAAVTRSAAESASEFQEARDFLEVLEQERARKRVEEN